MAVTGEYVWEVSSFVIMIVVGIWIEIGIGTWIEMISITIIIVIVHECHEMGILDSLKDWAKKSKIKAKDDPFGSPSAKLPPSLTTPTTVEMVVATDEMK